MYIGSLHSESQIETWASKSGSFHGWQTWPICSQPAGDIDSSRYFLLGQPLPFDQLNVTSFLPVARYLLSDRGMSV